MTHSVGAGYESSPELCGLRIASEDGGCCLEVHRRSDDPHHFVVRLTLGRVKVENDAVAFVERREFCAAIRGLHSSMTGRAVLRGTEDVEISLQPDGGSGALELHVLVVRHFTASASRTGRDLPARISLEGGFSVPGEEVSRVVRDLEAMFDDAA